MKYLYERRKKLWRTVLALLEEDLTVPIELLEELVMVDVEIEKGCINECFRNEKTV